MNKFEVAEKIINGEKQTRFDEVSGQAVVVTWDVPNEYIPNYTGNERTVVFRSLMDMSIGSIWKGFMGAANSGLNNISNKLNALFNGVQDTVAHSDYNDSFRATKIHTGLKVNLADDEVLVVYGADRDDGVVISGGPKLIADNNEICISVINTLPSTAHIKQGDIIGIGVFQKVVSKDQSYSGVNLNK